MTRGRPRNFNIDEAVEKAMVVFWTKGYDGTTIPDLTAALGVNRPSLYAAFGNKESLFRKVLDHYRNHPASYVNEALDKPTAAEVFAALMYGVVDLVTDPDRPGGCLFVCGALPAGSGNETISRELSARRIEGESEIRERFVRAKMEGDLLASSDPESLARLAATLMWGISVQAMGGADRTQLRKVADMAVGSFASMFAGG